MIPYSLEHIVTELNSNEAAAQALLEAFTGRVIPKPDALNLFKRLPDHKWYLSESLSRDVGFHVAAVDYIENFYGLVSAESNENRIIPSLKTIKHRAYSAIRFYFESKGNTTTF